MNEYALSQLRLARELRETAFQFYAVNRDRSLTEEDQRRINQVQAKTLILAKQAEERFVKVMTDDSELKVTSSEERTIPIDSFYRLEVWNSDAILPPHHEQGAWVLMDSANSRASLEGQVRYRLPAGTKWRIIDCRVMEEGTRI